MWKLFYIPVFPAVSKRLVLKLLAQSPPFCASALSALWYDCLRASNFAAWRPRELNRKFRQANATACSEKLVFSLFTKHLFPLKDTRITPSANGNWLSCTKVSCSNLHPLKTESIPSSFPLVSFPIPNPRRTHTDPSSVLPLAAKGPAAAPVPWLGKEMLSAMPAAVSCSQSTWRATIEPLAAYRKDRYQILNTTYLFQIASCGCSRGGGRKGPAQVATGVCTYLGTAKKCPTNL